MPSECSSNDPTTTPDPSAVVNRRNHHGPSSHGRTHWYAAAPMMPTAAPSNEQVVGAAERELADREVVVALHAPHCMR